MIRVIVTRHAYLRFQERGGNVESAVAIVTRKAPAIISTSIRCRSPRVALTGNDLPTVPVVEVSPRKYGIGLVVVTALPKTNLARIPHPTVSST